MLGNVGNLFVKCMREVTKDYSYHLFGALDYYLMYRHRAQSAAVLLNVGKGHPRVTDPLRWFCNIL